MMTRLFLSVLALSGTAFGSMGTKQAFVPKTLTDKQLAVRGGAGPLDADLVTNILTGIYMAQGTYMSLAPEAATDMYNVKEKSTMFVELSGITGALSLGLGILVYSLNVKGANVGTAVGAALIPNCLAFLKSLLNDMPTKVGFAREGQLVLGAAFAAGAYGGLTGADWADTAQKVAAVAMGLQGLMGAVAPAKNIELWKATKSFNAYSEMQLQVLSFWNVALATAIYTLLDGGDTATAVGRSALVLLALCLKMLFVSKEVEKLSMAPEPIYAWTAVLAAASYTLLA